MRRLVLVGVAAVVAVAVGAGLYLVLGPDDKGVVQGLAPAGDDPFGRTGFLDGAVRGIYSPVGSRLAVISDDGLGLADQGQIRPITKVGSKVVDAAWFRNSTTLLVAEGPVPTGGLAVVDIDGTVRGTVALEPSVGFGSGHGMAVAGDGRSAVVTAVQRPVLGPDERHLVVVDLLSGQTRNLTPPGGPNEAGPFYLDDGRVAFTEQNGDERPRALVADLSNGDVTEVAPGTTVAGTINDEVVLLDGRGRLFMASNRSRVIGSVPAEASLTTVDPSGGAAVVAETVAGPDGARRVRLRRIGLAAIRPS